MSRDSFPPQRSSASGATHSVDKESANALWRVPQWFPDLDPTVERKMAAYHSELLRFNSKVNLISKNTERDCDEVHFADCLLALKVMAGVKLGSRVCDIGSGNGLPGALFAILNPTTEFSFVESDSRKAEFLKHVFHEVGIPNAQVLNVRLETLKDMTLSTAITRGFASLSKTCLLCNKIFSRGGRVYHLKGNNWSSEIADFPSQLISLWRPELVGEYVLPVSQARRAVVCTTKST